MQFPAQTGAYKVCAKDKSLWYKHNAARLQISVGNPKHEGEKLFALTEWAAARFGNITLVVSDTLQRYNLALDMGISLDDAYDVAHINGRKWLRDNARALEAFTLPQRVVTVWDDWTTSHTDYTAAREELDILFNTHDGLKSAITQKAREFCERRKNGHCCDKALETSIAYILEEVAAFSVMFRHTQAIDIYPGAWFKEIFAEITTLPTSPLMAGFKTAECLRVDFTRNKAHQPANSG